MTDLKNNDLRPWSPGHQQTVYRHLLRAFSFPGRIEKLGDGCALTQVLATLVDSEVRLADPHRLVNELTRQRLQARIAAPEHAQFIVADGSKPPAWEPRQGSLDSPEQGATILLKVASLGHGTHWSLEGPGIETRALLAIGGLDPAWMDRRTAWNAAFPLGVDLVLMDATCMAALPRTTAMSRVTTPGETSWVM